VFAIWSFTPEGHYAYPAVAPRTLEQSNGRVSVVTAAFIHITKSGTERPEMGALLDFLHEVTIK
jgi:hypothetical protein